MRQTRQHQRGRGQLQYQWVVSVGGIIEPPYSRTAPDAKYAIRGGLVVPLYIIVLAFFGSA